MKCEGYLFPETYEFLKDDTVHNYVATIISVYLLVFGLGAPIAGWVSDKIGNKKQLLYSFFTMNFTLLGLIITRNVTIFTIIIILYFLGATYLNASVQSCLSEFGSYPKIKGFVFGVVGASESLGYAVVVAFRPEFRRIQPLVLHLRFH